MMLTRLMPAMACVALLAACASPGRGGRGAQRGDDGGVDGAADAAVAARQAEKAYACCTVAGQALPSDKTPWVRMAQIRFDSQQYGQAIIDALEAIERDPGRHDGQQHRRRQRPARVEQGAGRTDAQE